jgi:hypothetical protein
MRRKVVCAVCFVFLLMPVTRCQPNDIHAQADLVAFSYDRPMQLFALLESVRTYINGIDNMYVICRASNERYSKAYDVVQNSFPNVTFVYQGEDPSRDFKFLLMYVLTACRCAYLLFAVDDIIVKDFVDISECIAALEKTGAYGFFLRLGSHVTECYPYACKQRVPILNNVENDIYSWKFVSCEHDWGYPHTVDMTLYRKKGVEQDFGTLRFSSPNTLEGVWAACIYCVTQRKGLCYIDSKIINVPLNRVQHDYENRHMDLFSSQELLKLFEQGLKIDIKPLFKIKNQSAHMPYQPIFILR